MENPNDLTLSLLAHDLKPMGFEVVKLYESVDSTNLEAKRQGDTFTGNGIFISKEQTMGRGRRGRSWVSPKGTGSYVTMLLRPSIKPDEASMLTLIVGLAMAETIRDLYGIDARIKWPNDIVVGGRKLCGTLTELSTEIDFVNYVVVGTGINVLQRAFPVEIADVATSLLLEVGEGRIDKQRLITTCVGRFMKLYDKFVETKDLDFMKADYEELCVNISGDLRIEAADGGFTGKGLGITATGELVVEKKDGEILRVGSGEVSVRGIYGYV